MFNLLVLVVLVGLVVCIISGIVGFICDIRRFKSDIEFSGNRKQLINHLVFGDDNDVLTDSEVNENEN